MTTSRVLGGALAATVMFAGLGVATSSPAASKEKPAYCKDTGDLDSADMPKKVLKSECDLSGRVVRKDGLGITVPPAGRMVSAHADNYIDRIPTEFTIVTSEDGQVFDVDPEESASLPLGTATGGPAACDDGGSGSFARAIANPGHYVKINSPKGWRYNSSGEQVAGLPSIRQGQENMRLGNTDCTLITSRPNSTFVEYLGTTATRPNITGDLLSCTSDDGLSVTAWSSASGNNNGAVTCAFAVSDGSVTAVDILINSSTTKYIWDDVVQDGCKDVNGKRGQDLEGLITHEWGHGYGLAHVSESTHGNLVMSQFLNGTCNTQERTLGRGDLEGMIAIYGRR